MYVLYLIICRPLKVRSNLIRSTSKHYYYHHSDAGWMFKKFFFLMASQRCGLLPTAEQDDDDIRSDLRLSRLRKLKLSLLLLREVFASTFH